MPLPSQRTLSGQVAVVTGSSTGIGRAIALELAAAGAHVVIHARQNRTDLEAVASEVRAYGVECKMHLADLSDPNVASSMIDSCWNWQTKVDVWINNAGADVLTGEAAEWSFERKLSELWAVDVLGTIRLSRAIGERMKPVGGVILNMGWDRAEIGMAGSSGEMFSATKGAIMAFSRSLARSLAPQVRVNCLAPGWIKTAWGDQASGYWQRRAQEEALLQRWGTPQDVAATACFLVSPAASFITGQIVCVNGGQANMSAQV